MGFTTATGGVVFEETITAPMIQSAIITHRDATTQEVFEMYKRFYANLPNELKADVLASNAKEIVFNNKEGTGLDSKIKCMTATDDGVGRGGTTQKVHMSEYAFWKNAHETYISIMQCVPDTPNSMVIIESTANGYNDFKKLWDKAVAGESDFIPLFFAWFEMPSYRKTYTGFDLTKEEIELMKRFNLDKEQITWRRWCIENNCGGDIDKFRQEYPSTPEEAFLFTGKSYFDMDKLKSAKENCKKPKKRGYFKFQQDANLKPIDETIEWVDDDRGCIKVYENPMERVPYVIGGDTAGDGSDNFVGQCLNNITGNQSTSYKYEGADELQYAQQMYCLGRYYNWALLAVETNYSTYPQKKLQEWSYPSLYIRETFDNFTGKPKSAYGFRTDVITRPNILANLQSVVKNHPELIHDYETICELETFVVNEKTKAEAMDGAHDDCVMSLAIAYHARQQQQFELFDEALEAKSNTLPYALTQSEDDEEYTDDEDYGGDYDEFYY